MTGSQNRVLDSDTLANLTISAQESHSASRYRRGARAPLIGLNRRSCSSTLSHCRSHIVTIHADPSDGPTLSTVASIR